MVPAIFTWVYWMKVPLVIKLEGRAVHSHHGSHGSLGSPFGWGSICAYLRRKNPCGGNLHSVKAGCTREKKESLQGGPTAAYLSKGSESTMSGSMSDPMLQSAVVLRYPRMRQIWEDSHCERKGLGSESQAIFGGRTPINVRNLGISISSSIGWP